MSRWTKVAEERTPYQEPLESQPVAHEEAVMKTNPEGRPISEAEARIKFVLAGVTGPAIFTLVSRKTGARFTYRVQKGGEGKPWWVRVLTGPDNTSDYTYAGFIPEDATTKFITGKKGMDSKAPCVIALRWFLKNPGHPGVEFYHEGRCGRCGRPLTVPESIEAGYGPTCAGLV